MSTKKKRTPPRVAIARKLDRLAASMEKLGLEMQFYVGFGEMAEHGIEMQGAAKIARTWAKGIRATP